MCIRCCCNSVVAVCVAVVYSVAVVVDVGIGVVAVCVAVVYCVADVVDVCTGVVAVCVAVVYCVVVVVDVDVTPIENVTSHQTRS